MAQIKAQSDSFDWSVDSSGKWLKIKLPDPGRILDQLKEGLYDIIIKPHRKKRSLDQNSLYWSTLTQLAEHLKISNAELHNLMLRRYGQIEHFDDQTAFVVLPDTDEAEKQAAQAETYQLKPTSQTKIGNDGKSYRTYILLRGSSTYDTAEMTQLIDGLMDEARQVGLILEERRYE